MLGAISLMVKQPVQVGFQFFEVLCEASGFSSAVFNKGHMNNNRRGSAEAFAEGSENIKSAHYCLINHFNSRDNQCTMFNAS